MVALAMTGCGGVGESTSSDSVSIPTVDPKKADERAIKDVIDQFYELDIRSEVEDSVTIDDFRPLAGPEMLNVTERALQATSNDSVRRVGRPNITPVTVEDLTASTATAWVCYDDRDWGVTVNGQLQDVGPANPVPVPVAFVMVKRDGRWKADRYFTAQELAGRFSCGGTP